MQHQPQRKSVVVDKSHRPRVAPSQERKTLIGVLASRDDVKPNAGLVSIFEELCGSQTLEQFHFVLTGGTYRRLFEGDENLNLPRLSADTAKWLQTVCGVTYLPPANEGGITLLSFLVTHQKCSILWPFWAPHEGHWLRPENLALMRLCDHWHVKRLMNKGSVMAWNRTEAEEDAQRNLQQIPLRLTLYDRDSSRPVVPARKDTSISFGDRPFDKLTLALIAHNEMKTRMIEFAVDHQAELMKFKRIFATGTTGREVAANTSRSIDSKMVRFHSGPKGGDIEIATAILYGECDLVIFFVDPLQPHPHIEDIRVVFEACMVNDSVMMITNEMHAREFMSRVVRGKNRGL